MGELLRWELVLVGRFGRRGCSWRLLLAFGAIGWFDGGCCGAAAGGDAGPGSVLRREAARAGSMV